MKNEAMMESLKSFKILQKLPNGVCIYRGSPETRHLAPDVVRLLKWHLSQGDDLRFRDVEELYEAFDDKRCVYALDQSGKLVGFVFFGVYISSNPEKKSFLSNSSLIMETSLRGYGIGKNMKRQLHHIAGEDYPDFDVISLSSNPIIFHLNKQMRFNEISNQNLWEIYGFDMIKECENRPNLMCRVKRRAISNDPFENTKIFHVQTGRLIKNMVFNRTKR